MADGGFLIVGDFYPSTPIKVPYHHLGEQKIYTYKQDYAATFLASRMYYSICLMTGDHSTKTLGSRVAEHERTGVWLLRKMLYELFV